MKLYTGVSGRESNAMAMKEVSLNEESLVAVTRQACTYVSAEMTELPK